MRKKTAQVDDGSNDFCGLVVLEQLHENLGTFLLNQRLVLCILLETEFLTAVDPKDADSIKQAASDAAVRAFILTTAGSHTQAVMLSAMSSLRMSTPYHVPPKYQPHLRT